MTREHPRAATQQVLLDTGPWDPSHGPIDMLREMFVKTARAA